MTIRSANVTVVICTLFFTALGGLIGWGLGKYAPDFYRAVYRGGHEYQRGGEPKFDPVSLGLGSGLTQGVAGGTGVGQILVALFVWRDTRLARPATVPTSATPPAPVVPPAPTARTYGGKLLAPWAVLGVGFLLVVAIPDPHTSLGFWYLLLIVCLFLIVWFLVSGIWALLRSEEQLHSRAAWGFVSGCFLNALLLGKVGGH